ncbi:proline-rich receptor-like protein kinase PERK1 [Cyanistes caeruleus]|uniref:proline-rich receptor-like protein kinase PERK1 n=1 Tax=Cyanistes caeruleus TaxID=156563 RepID=UPI000CDA81D3|nr:proline-rich receptor-like protein kinase PERK1 [Cyanistes caeruleus]
MLSDLERRHVLEEMSVQTMTYARGSNVSVPAADAGKEEIPGPGTGEALGKSNINAENPPSTPRVFCPQDVRKSCMIGTVVTLFTVPLSMVLCYVGFRWWKDKKRRPAAAAASRPRRHDSPLPPGSPKTVRFDSSQTWPQKEESFQKAEHQHSVPPPRPPSPAVKQKPPEIPPPPPLPSRPPWSS